MIWAPHYTYNFIGPSWGVLAMIGAVFLLFGIIWSLFWKGLALWHAARKGHKKWFVVLLVVNTFGILEILYLYVFNKQSRAVEK